MEEHRETGGPESEGHLMRYNVIIEKGPTSYGAHVPELPGCVAVAETREEVSNLIRDAIQIYINELEKNGLPVPQPSSSS
jgi:predicted RNase H-like HicB family nuclease